MPNKKSRKPENAHNMLPPHLVKPHDVPPPPPPKPHDVPPHILKEIFDLKEKVGRLEGKIEVLLNMKSK